MNEFGRHGLQRWLCSSAVRRYPVLDTCPKGCLIDIELVAKYVPPYIRTVRVLIWGPRDPGSENTTVVQVLLVRDVMIHGLAISYALPATVLAMSSGDALQPIQQLGVAGKRN